jgi:hypothetical protein
MMISSKIPAAVRRRAISQVQRAFATEVSGITDIQKAHWASYLATGRGTAALFGSLDVDRDGLLSAKEVRAFLESAQRSSGDLPRACRILETAEEHPLAFHEFQHWLLAATEGKIESSNIQPWYETSPHTGARRSEGIGKEGEKPEYSWNESSMSQSLRKMQYAVRGEVVMAAEKMAAEGKEIIYTNIGNPQAVGQKPITYYRQVLSLCDLPAECGVDHPNANAIFPQDALEHAREIRAIIGPCGTGAYSHSQGIAGFRKHVAEFITERDGHPSFQGDIFLTNGASTGIELILSGLISSDYDAIMIPIPQYPIYSAIITNKGGHQVGYALDESIGWGVTKEELYKRLHEARGKGLSVKGLALINPGNPTGQVMSSQDIATVCQFCSDNGIVLLADEVYQR